MVEVTQADRNAADAYADSDGVLLVEAFARHRTEALAAKDAEIAELRAGTEALGEALHGLSAMLLLNRALEDDKTHAAYEKVVARFSALGAKP